MNFNELAEGLEKAGEAETLIERGYLAAPVLCQILGIKPSELEASIQRLAVKAPQLIEAYVGVMVWIDEQQENEK